jgi:hypothetical protein
MRRIAVWTLVATVGIAGFAAGRAFTQDQQPKMPSPEEMQKMMDEFAAPAPEHKKLQEMVGTWDAEMTMIDPTKPEPTKEKGVTVFMSVLNGLFVQSSHKATMGGKPFEGVGIDGYSKEKHKYFAFWADQMGSTPMILWGEASADGKTITYDGETYDCGPMGQMTPRTKITVDDADHRTFEFWAKMGGAPDYMKMMEIKYSRRK